MNEPQIQLTGHLAFDPEVRTTSNGVPVTDLRVATSRRFKVGEEWQDGETLWFDVACWKQLAENVGSSLKKGDKVVVEGKLIQKTWVRDDGTSSVKLVVDARTVGVDLARYPVKVLKPVRPGSAGELLEGKWVSEETGEIADAPAAFADEDELAA